MGEKYRKKEREGLSEEERKELARTMGLPRRRGIYKRGIASGNKKKKQGRIRGDYGSKTKII